MIQPVRRPEGRPITTAVTGTNGKTSVATATIQLMRGAGWRSAGYDSIGITDVAGVLHPSNIRKSTSYLPELIAEQVRDGAEAISLEAFVGILADGLFQDVPVDVAVCTGLERDHLDVHGSVEAYWAPSSRCSHATCAPTGWPSSRPTASRASACARPRRAAAPG